MDAKDIQKVLEEQRQKAEIYNKTDKQISAKIASNALANDPVWRESHRRATTDNPEWYDKIKQGHKRFWDNVDPSHREHIAKKAFDKSISFESVEQAHEIFWQCWAEDRGEKLYKKLAKKYDVGYEGIINLVRGGRDNNGPKHHAYCPVDESTLEQMKQDWQKKYQSYKVCAVLPGYDQLDNYDRLYKESGLYTRLKGVNKLALPSLVFHCRFMLENPTLQTVKEYCDSIGIPKENNDMRQYKILLVEKFPWLRNELSETYEFDSYEELAEFLNNHPANKGIRKVSRELAWDYVKHRIQWKGENFLGWMFYKKELVF